MHTNAQNMNPKTIMLRQAAGRLLKQLRELAGLSQRQFAAEVHLNNYNFISQIETGRNRIPPDELKTWAKAYRVTPRELGLLCLRFYDPETFTAIFENDQSALAGDLYPKLIALTSNVKEG